MRRGLDFWENMESASNYNGSYGTELFGNRAVDLITQHDQSQVKSHSYLLSSMMSVVSMVGDFLFLHSDWVAS